MSCAVVQEQIAEVAETLRRRTDELAIVLAQAITREVSPYRPGKPVPFDLVAQACAANMRPIFGAIATQGEFDSSAATELGVERARDGVPLSSVMEAYRVGFRRVWEAVAEEVASRAHMNGDALSGLMAKLLVAQDVFTGAMAVGYREEQTGVSRRRIGPRGPCRLATPWTTLGAMESVGSSGLSAAAEWRPVRGHCRRPSRCRRGGTGER